MLKLSFVQILSIITTAAVIGTFVGVNIALSNLSTIIIQTRDTLESQSGTILQNIEHHQETAIKSAENTELLIGGQEQTSMLLNETAELTDRIDELESEITTLKQEIVDLKQDLVESRVIIEEQRENITAS